MYYVKATSVFWDVASCKIAIMIPSKPPDPIMYGSPGYGSYNGDKDVGAQVISWLEGIWTVEHTSSAYVYCLGRKW